MTLTEGQPTPSGTNASPAETSSPAAPPAYSAPSSSSEASPAQSSAPAAPPAYSAPSSSSSEASPAQSSAPSAPIYPVASSSDEASPAQSSAPAAPPAYMAPSSLSSQASPALSSAPAAPPAYSAPSSSSSQASPAQSSAPAAPPAYSAPSPSSNEASPAQSSAPSAPIYPVASSSGASPETTSSAPALSPYAGVKQGGGPQSSAPSSSNTGTSSGSGKRGLAYNDASLTKCFEGSREISWAFNWASSSDGLSSNFMFVPTLWGDSTEFTSKWSDNAQAAIESGSTHLFSFNEPDLPAQANMACGPAATAYAQYMNPFKGKAQLCAPSVTNGGGQMGLAWLKDFLAQCTDCQIDCLNIHWYDSASNVEYFKQHIQDAAALAPGKPIYVSEFGATGSDDEINSFLQEVMPWMDSNSDVAGYAYFMASDSKLVTGTEPSTYGKTYMSYTG
ncbi:glycoside hydrolase family 128 protein [Cercospora zeae-maydis SCOH1-5]|uniref:Glycoside hydrolase family 128 protein n=1 Tax=Cercospora zeae-maydis SCOH1-5 TaxID=717836 RepID=A0A6A6FJ59_9PEZI|nr:glycoside hydrolase family 128 protein [Cercospora zeae-maydis SCOH1-5]